MSIQKYKQEMNKGDKFIADKIFLHSEFQSQKVFISKNWFYQSG